LNAGGILFILLVLFLIGCGAWIAYRIQQKRREEFFMLATKLGLTYSRDDPFDTVDYPFDLFGRGDKRGAENFIYGVTNGLDVRLFDYYYVEYSSDTQGHRTSSTYRFSCALTQVDAMCPHIALEHEGLLSGFARHLGFHDIEFESEEFNRAWKVHAEDKKCAYALCDARMMQWLLDEGGVAQYEVYGRVILCYTKRVSPPEYENLLEVLRRFHAHVPTVLASLYPRDGAKA